MKHKSVRLSHTMNNNKNNSNFGLKHNSIGKISVLNLNGRSIRNKKSVIETFLHSLNYPDILCFTETWLTTEEAPVIKLSSYKLAVSYCRQICRGGGIMIFVKENLTFSNVGISFSEDCVFEVISGTVSNKNWKINISCIYRTPKANDEHFLASLEKLLILTNKPDRSQIVCGDFNFDFLESNKKKIADIVTLFCSYGLNQLFFKSSRVQGNSSSLVDNVFSNADANNVDAATIDTILSDHSAQLVHLKIDNLNLKDDKCVVQSRKFNGNNITYFKTLLVNEAWQAMYSENTDTKRFEAFFKIFLDHFDTAFPVLHQKAKPSKNKRPWLTEHLVEEGRLLRDLYCMYKSSNDVNLKIKYKLSKKRHLQNIENAKRNYNDNKILNSVNYSRAAWSVINNSVNVKNCSSKIPNEMRNESNVIFSNSNDIAEEFNHYFISSVDSLVAELDTSINDNYGAPNSKVNPNSIFLVPVTPNEVRNIISGFSSKRSAGYDDIPYFLIKEIAEYIIEPLAYLINISFETGHFPEQLKIAEVVPVFKKGNPDNFKNYRPIALLPAFSKVFEKLFLSRLQMFFKKFDLLSPQQFGYTEGKSTVDAILSFYEKILSNFDEKSKTIGIFFDLTRAFDTINLAVLLKKLSDYGIRGVALKWIESFLVGRQQLIRISQNGQAIKSSSADTKYGVPQGSVLGPFLFVVFINDLIGQLRNDFITLFADDTSVIITAENFDLLYSKIQQCVKIVTLWCKANGLVLNASKTNILQFVLNGASPDRSFLIRSESGTSIQPSETLKFLGVWLDQNINWCTHIQHLLKTLASKHYSVLQLRNCVNLNTLMIYYWGCIHSALAYGIICWGSSSEMTRIFILQKRILRSMLSLPYTESCRAYFRQYGILTVYSIYIYECVSYIHKNIENFPRCGDINTYTTRIANNIYVPYRRLTQTQKGVSTAIRIYNRLPQEFKTFKDIKKFKMSVKTFLRERCFYSVEEYFVW